MLRIAGADETARDAIIQAIADRGVGVNVHYIPMAMLTLFRNRGFDIADYPKTYELYSNEITLPLYNGLTDEQVDEVIRVVIESVEQVI
jgi:dTDP-4-amino-4,6-dideoxygalactose transaminase